MKEYKIDKLKCAGCGACIDICPNYAIKIGEDGKINIDEEKCNQCGKCIKACPFDAIKYE
jgi:ferredoxin